MATLLEMAKDIIIAHASKTEMNKEELLGEIAEIHSTLSRLQKAEEAPETAEGQTEGASENETAPVVSVKKAFKKDKVICLICGKGMKTLSRHLKSAHDMSASEYKKQFDIPKKQPLAARNYSESRREMAIARGLGDNLAKARAAKRAAKK
ncbi:MAG: MucR family transcriptional regulator [Deltaproteobacteria bacterium]|nr:MucR family transcriptional regulator [Deltaproteobacteria bacterium]